MAQLSLEAGSGTRLLRCHASNHALEPLSSRGQEAGLKGETGDREVKKEVKKETKRENVKQGWNWRERGREVKKKCIKKKKIVTQNVGRGRTK